MRLLVYWEVVFVFALVGGSCLDDMGKPGRDDAGATPGVLDALDAWDKRVSYAMYLGNSPVAKIAMPVCKILE